ncbi:MAG: monofunctional biosynthetic peptidoglycan transglycosylase [bacterium]
MFRMVLSLFRWLAKFTLRLIIFYFLLILVIMFALRWLPVPTSAFMVQHNIQVVLGERQVDYAQYEWQAFSEISPQLALAAIAAEDQRFPHHHGVDFRAIRAALKANRGKPRGASTITQQVVKNLFLWEKRSYFRKGLEAILAMMLELVWSKERILEVYLNIAQFGKQEYGVAIASKKFLGADAENLSRKQAALLAGVLPSPQVMRADKPNRRLIKRQRWIERQMKQLGGVRYLLNL